MLDYMIIRDGTLLYFWGLRRSLTMEWYTYLRERGDPNFWLELERALN